MAYDAASPAAQDILKAADVEMKIGPKHVSITDWNLQQTEIWEIKADMAAVDLIGKMKDKISEHYYSELSRTTVDVQKHKPSDYDPRLHMQFAELTYPSSVVARTIRYLQHPANWAKGQTQKGHRFCMIGGFMGPGRADGKLADHLILLAGQLAYQRFGGRGADSCRTGIHFNDAATTTHPMLIAVLLDLFEKVGGKFLPAGESQHIPLSVF